MGDLGLATAHKPKENLGLRVLETYKKFRDKEDLFDCWIKAGKKTFPVHSPLLAATSEDLRNEILHGKKEITLEGVKQEIVERCIDLLYGEHGENLEDNMEDILQVSSKIKFDGVKDFCFDFMEENLTVQNCFTAVERAKSYDRTEVLQSAEEFISENFKGVIESQEFLLLSKEDLLHYIEISNADHEIIWKAVMRWIDETKQDKLLAELMNAIDIKNFPIEFLMGTVWKETRVQDLAKEVIIQSVFSDLEKLKEGITIGNCFSVKSFNQAHNTINKQAVKMTVTRFMAESLAQIKDEEEFMFMDLQDLIEILQASESPPAIEKWEAVVRWTKHDSNREIYFSQLMDALNFETVAFDFLLGVIWKEPLVQKNKKLRKKIAEILFASRQEFETKINVDNCFLLTNINLKYNSANCVAVAEMLRRFMEENCERIMEKQEYLKLEKDDVSHIWINAKTNEMTKWQGLIKWINADETRQRYLQEMISALKLEEFSFNFLLQVYNEPLVQKSESVRLQVIDGILSNLSKLQHNITKENCLALKKMFDETSTARQHIEAEKIVNRHVMFNLESVILESEFPILSYDSLASILQSPESVVQSDVAKWEAVLRWVKHEKTRKVHLPELMEILGIHDPSYFQALWKEPLVQDCEAAKVSMITRLFCDVTKLHEILTIDNCFFIVDVNKNHNSLNPEEVRVAFVAFMARNFDEISERPGFMALPKDDVASILEITTTTEMGKWQAMIKWIKFEKSRPKYLYKMMKAAKVNIYTFDFLLQAVYNEPFVQKSDSAKSLVVTAIFMDLQRLEISINESNCLTLKHLVDSSLTKQDDAKKIVNRYIMLNIGTLSERPEFLALGLEGIVSVLQSPESTIQSDEIKWRAVLRWMKHEKIREDHLPKLLEILKTQDFSLLVAVVWTEPLVQDSKSAKISVVTRLFQDVTKLREIITADNCFFIVDLNKKKNSSNHKKVWEALVDFMAKNFSEISEREGFMRFARNDVASILKIATSTEMGKWQVIIKWIKCGKSRKNYLEEMMRAAKVDEFTFDFLLQTVYKEPLVQKSDSAKSLVVRAIFMDLQRLETSINESNCLTLKHLMDSSLTKRTDAKTIVNRYVMLNLGTLSKHPGFLLLGMEGIVSLFDAPVTTVQSDKTIWEAVLRWVKHEKTREDHLPKLLEILKIQDLSLLVAMVWKEPLVQDSEAAKLYVVASLFRDVTQLREIITVDNCFFIVDVNKKQNSSNRKKVWEALVDFMARNFHKISERPGFMQFAKNEVASVLTITTTTEMEKWQAMIKWIKFGKSRKTYLEEMMRAAKVDEFTLNFLLQTVYNDPLVQKYDSTKSLVVNSLFLDLQRLETSINVSNCLTLKHLMDSSLTKQDDAKTIVNRYVMLKLGILGEHPEFLALGLEGILSVLQSSESTAQFDETKWNSVLRWLKHEKTRENHLPKLLEILKIQDFSLLVTVVWNELLVQDCEAAKVSVITRLFCDVTKLHEILTTDNCFFIMDVNKKHNSTNRKEVGEAMIDFMAGNFEEISEKQGFMPLTKDDVISMLEVTTTTEIGKWQAMLKWIKFDESRENYLEKLMRAAKLNEFTFDFLLQTAYNEPFVQKSDSAKSLVVNSLFSDLQRLERSINESNCLTLKHLVDSFLTKKDETEKIVNRYVMFNLGSLSEHSGFLALDLEGFVSVLQSSESTAQSDETKWKSVLGWMKHEKMREGHLPKLLEILMIQDFSLLVTVVWKEPLVQDCEAAKVFVVTRLFFDVSKLCEILTVDNCFFIVDVNKKHNSTNREEVREALVDFMARNFENILEKHGFMALVKDDVISILEITTTTQMEKWQAMMKWIKFGRSRKYYLDEMMGAAKVDEFTFDFLLQTIYNDPLVQKSDSAKSLVVNSLFSDLQRLERSINESNCLTLKNLADSSSTKQDDAEKIVNRYIMLNLGTLSEHPEFLGLDLEGIVSLLLSQESTAPFDETKWKSILRWMKHEKTRENHLPKLLEILKIQDFSFLVAVVWKEPLVQDCEAAKASVITQLFCDVTKLHEILTVDNCFFIVDVNKRHNSSNPGAVREALVDFMARNLEKISGNQEFMALMKDDVTSMLEITTTTEMAKWKAMMRWIKFGKSRENYLEEMMRAAKVNEFTFDFLLQTVNNEPLDSAKSLVVKSLFSNLQRLQRRITKTNCLTLKRLMDSSFTKHADAEKIVNRYLMLNLGSLSEHLGFLELVFECIASLFATSESTTQSEETKWEAVLRWVKHDKTRDVHLPKLLDILKIQDFPFLFLTIWQDYLVQESEETKIVTAKELFTNLRKLEANINIDNCFQLQDLNDAYNHVNRDDAGRILIHFMMQHFEKIVGKVEFVELYKPNLMKLIESPDAKAGAEMKFKAIVKWVKHDEGREVAFLQMFKLLDLKAMDIEYVRDVVMKEPLVMNSQECLLYLSRPDGGQHPSFAIVDRNASELTVLSLEDDCSHSVSIFIGYRENIRGMVTVGGEVYLVTNKRISKVQNDGRVIPLQHLKYVWAPSQVVEFQEKIYIIEPQRKPMLCFDPADNSLIDDLPGCGLGFGFCASSTEDSIYAMGGSGTENKAKRFDARTRTWSDIASMSKGRRFVAVAILDGKVYVMGEKNRDSKPTASVGRYCPESNSWTEISNMNASRFIFSACVFNGQLYAIGGDGRREENGFYESSMEVYNKQLDQWMMIHKYETTGWSSCACIWPHGPLKPGKATTKSSDETKGSSRQLSTSAMEEQRSDDAQVKGFDEVTKTTKKSDKGVPSHPSTITEAEQRKGAAEVQGSDDRYAQLSEEIDRRIKTKSTKSKMIGPEGGFVKNFGCTVTYRPKTYAKATKVETSLITDFSDCPEGKIPIAPIIECNPSGRLKPPALLEVEHWAYPTGDDGAMEIEVFQKDTDNSNWRFIENVRITRNQKITFYAGHFSRVAFVIGAVAVAVAAVGLKKLKHHLIKVRLQSITCISGRNQTIACTCILNDEKIKTDMLRSLEHAGFGVSLIVPETILAHFNEVKIKIACLEPQNLQIFPNGHGNAQDFREFESVFQVHKISENQPETQYLTIRLENANLTKFNGFLRFRYSHTADDDNSQHETQIQWPIPGAVPIHQTTVPIYGNIRTNTIVAPDPRGDPPQQQ